MKTGATPGYFLLVLLIKVVLFFHFGHQGASLFSKPNAKMAAWGVIRDQKVMKVGMVGP